MTREETIINFLKRNNLLIGNNCLPEGYKPHYNLKQINLFSNLEVTQKELNHMERNGLISHYWFKDHENCYYVKEGDAK